MCFSRLRLYTDGTYLGAVGDAWERMDKLEEALEFYERALRLDPKSINSLYCRARALLDLRRFEPALECLERALEYGTESAGVHNKKAQARFISFCSLSVFVCFCLFFGLLYFVVLFCLPLLASLFYLAVICTQLSNSDFFYFADPDCTGAARRGHDFLPNCGRDATRGSARLQRQRTRAAQAGPLRRGARSV